MDLPGKHRIAAGSRLNFVAQIQAACALNRHFIYDSLGMARAHNIIWPVKRPFMTFICGIEVWENVVKNRIQGARRADLLLSISEYTLKRAAKLNGCFGKARVCWLGSESDTPIYRIAYSDVKPVVMIVSRIDVDGYKGHKELIECWPRVLQRIPEARLRIVGKGPGEQAVRTMVDRSPVRSNIDLLGFVDDGELEDLWASSTVFCMPSRGEGFGLVYIEAMRRGVPVIGSIHDAAPEINLHGITGFNVNLDDPGDLPRRIVQLLQDSALCREFGNNGVAWWQKSFSFSSFRERFVSHLYDLLRL